MNYSYVLKINVELKIIWNTKHLLFIKMLGQVLHQKSIKSVSKWCEQFQLILHSYIFQYCKIALTYVLTIYMFLIYHSNSNYHKLFVYLLKLYVLVSIKSLIIGTVQFLLLSLHPSITPWCILQYVFIAFTSTLNCVVYSIVY